MQMSKSYIILKRLTDILVAAIGLLLAFPILIVTAMLVYLETPGPVLYKQERLGKDGKEFEMYKIRSMYLDAEKNGAVWASDADDRITKVGSFIRRTRIDEIPQLLNIIIGDMSLVGPRPERAVFYNEFEKNISNFRDRLADKPGLSGWAQINGGYDLTPSEKLSFDLWYIEHANLVLDIKILLKTIGVIISGDGAR
ncbi:sugar transferase [Proteiniclasticum ruminis]|uniref:sugar transferase n=1 Tax=Proteiniclasticum ruminis TaxID=398199 RepID=UPI0028A93CC9|nr:sugar transferase [Proteiniclasticum ruminis]